jgi:integrase
MIRRVKLYARVNEGNGRFSRIAVPFNKNGRAIEVKPKQGHVTSYLIRKGGKFLNAGADLEAAVTFLRQNEPSPNGSIIEITLQKTHEATDRVSLQQAISKYISEQRTLDKAKATITAYSNALEDFSKACRKTFLDEIGRDDILAFIQWMRDHIKARVPGRLNATIRNRLTYLGVFLGNYGIKLFKEKGKGADAPGLLFSSDRPKIVKTKPTKYSQETITQLLDAADLDEKDYLLFLNWSGFRDEEVQYLLYSDFNWKASTASVHAKPQYGWKPKDAEERTVVLPTEITKRMKERMGRPQQYKDARRKPNDNDLVFPNGDGNPDSHLIYRIHAVAKEAGLNLKGKRAGHMFRKTAGSRVAKKMGLRAAMEFLGHTDVETTALYLAADDLQSKRSRQAVEQMYQDGD